MNKTEALKIASKHVFIQRSIASITGWVVVAPWDPDDLRGPSTTHYGCGHGEAMELRASIKAQIALSLLLGTCEKSWIAFQAVENAQASQYIADARVLVNIGLSAVETKRK